MLRRGIREWLSVVSCQLSAISYQGSVVSGQEARAMNRTTTNAFIRGWENSPAKGQFRMKNVLLFSVLFCAVSLPALAELTPQDLDKIRLIVNEATTPIKTDVAWLRGKIDNLDKQISWLMVLIVVAVGIPQVIVAWRSRKDREQDRKIKELTRDIETLKQRQIINP